MTVALFVLAGVLFVLAVTLMSDRLPFTDIWLDEWAPITAFLAGLAGWILFGYLAWTHTPTWNLYLAVAVPLAAACILAGWHFWERSGSISGCLDLIMALTPVVGGFGPVLALAIWSWRGGMTQAGWLAIWGAATGVIATSSVYLNRWNDPRFNISISDLVNMGSGENPLAKALDNAKGAEELRQVAVIQELGGILTVSHLREVWFRYLLSFACAVLSCLLWWLAPEYGVLGIAGGLIAIIPTSIFWYRAQPNRAMRLVLLGPGATLYESTFGVAVIFFIGQAIWVVRAL